jgi:hypothetical protein
LEAITGWKNPVEYGSSTALLPNEHWAAWHRNDFLAAPELAARLALTSGQRDDFAAQAQMLAEARDHVAQDMEAFKNEAAEAAAALRGEIAGLEAALVLRDRKIAEAQELLATASDLMTGASGLRQMLTRWALSANSLSAMTDYQAAATAWQNGVPPAAGTKKYAEDESQLDCVVHPPHWQPGKSGAQMLTEDQPITSLAQLLALHHEVRPAHHAGVDRATQALQERDHLRRRDLRGGGGGAGCGGAAGRYRLGPAHGENPVVPTGRQGRAGHHRRWPPLSLCAQR